MQTRPYAVPTLLELIRTHRFRIPQFQRNFRWTNAQIKLLIDSMARNYPMGSLLALAKNPEIPLQSRSIDAYISKPDVDDLTSDCDLPDTDSLFYVLDGQQRLTSIARVFLNGDPNRAFYFDLKEMIESFSSEDDNTSWIKALRRREKNTDRLENNRLIRGDIAMDRSKIEIYVSEYIEDSGEFPEWEQDRTRQRQEAAKIKGVFETLRNYQIPIVVLERDAGLESVCRVFKTINSTGTRLTTFDLAVARFYPQPDLRTKWEEALSSYPVLEEFNVDGERVLQVLVLRFAEESGSALEVNRGTQLKLKSSYVKSNWDEAIKSLARAYEWAKSMGARRKTLTNHALLVAIGSHWCVRPMLEPDHLLLKRWFFSNLLQPGATQAANYRISRYFKALRNLASGETDRDIIPEVYITPKILRGLTQASDSRFKALQCVLSAAIREDLISGLPVMREDIEDHHLYPKAYCKQQGLDAKLCESIVNRIAVSRETNRSLGYTGPETYFTELTKQAKENGTVKGMQARLQACFIPNASKATAQFSSQFSPEKFDIFMNRRAKLLVDEVRRVVGSSLVTEEPDDYDEDI